MSGSTAVQKLLAEPNAAPALTIPHSSSTVNVRIIDPTCYGTASSSAVLTPQIPGMDNFTVPSYAFLISHGSANQAEHVLFDAGIRKDWDTALPPDTVSFIRTRMPCEVEKDIDEILDEDVGKIGIKSKDISAIIWSHHHFDHRGNITKFPPTTELVWGPGSTAEYAPGYPADSHSSILEEELRGRNVRELTDSVFELRIGGFPAHDFFSDGSFYLLSAPGHTVGHLCALARVTSGTENGAAAFIFMGGDCCHHPGIFRPSGYLPLPFEIPAAPYSRFGMVPCPGALFVEHIHPEKNPVEPFLKANQGVNVDQVKAEASIYSMQGFDADENVLVCLAHDMSFLSSKLVDFYPECMNDWKSKSLKKDLRWWFCGDFNRSGMKEAAGAS